MEKREDRFMGVVLRDRREKLGLTQTDLALRLGRTQSFVSKVESGTRALRITESIAYAEALDTVPETLVAELRCAAHDARLAVRRMEPLPLEDDDWLVR